MQKIYSSLPPVAEAGKTIFIHFIGWMLLMLGSGAAAQENAVNELALHRPFDLLLRIYVEGTRVNYDKFSANPRDKERLSGYISSLEALDPAAWSDSSALAYWINLYNAATLDIVLERYPVKSIKNIGGAFKKKVAQVAGKPLSLDQIENDIIRPRFHDPRVHFALNCAAVSCPPLAPHAYSGSLLSSQLDEACRAALNDSGWVQIGVEELRVSKIFDWYRQDFGSAETAVREFIARYRPQDREAIMDASRKLKYLDYDWRLNRIR